MKATSCTTFAKIACFEIVSTWNCRKMKCRCWFSLNTWKTNLSKRPHEGLDLIEIGIRRFSEWGRSKGFELCHTDSCINFKTERQLVLMRCHHRTQDAIKWRVFFCHWKSHVHHNFTALQIRKSVQGHTSVSICYHLLYRITDLTTSSG